MVFFRLANGTWDTATQTTCPQVVGSTPSSVSFSSSSSHFLSAFHWLLTYMLGQYGQMSDHYTRVHDENKHIGDSNSFALPINWSAQIFFQDLPLRSWLWSQERFRGEQRLSQKSKKKILTRWAGRGRAGTAPSCGPRRPSTTSKTAPTPLNRGSYRWELGSFCFLSSVFQVAFSAPRAPYQVWRYLCLYKHCMYFLGPRKVGVILWQRRPFKQKPIWCSGQNHFSTLIRSCEKPFFQVERKAIFSGCAKSHFSGCAKSHGISGGRSSRKYYWSFGDNRCEVGVGVNCIDFNVNIINR